MALRYYTDEVMLGHASAGHVEQPARLEAVLEAVKAFDPDAELRPPDAFERTAVERVHPASYVDAILSLEGKTAELDYDTLTTPGSVAAIRAAVGCSLGAVRAAIDGHVSWALVRPPGHHAEPTRAMGFCFFSNVAIAAEEARALGIDRVMIIDWDVHHGNGTQAAFYDRDDVFFFSTHQWPLYPGTGAAVERGVGDGVGSTLNVPMPAGSDDDDYRRVFEEILAPAAKGFRPELLLVSAGFDAHVDDPLGGMEVSSEGFGELCDLVRGIADEHANGRLAFFLEGGYDLKGLSQSVVACLERL